MNRFKRSVPELQDVAVMWWPEELREKNALVNVLPLLLRTQDDFLALLSLCKKDPFQIFDLVDVARFPGNLFLKHLIVLTDYGGEPIQRLGRSFHDIFNCNQDKEFFMEFSWNGKTYKYTFQELPTRGLNNKKLLIDGESLSMETSLSPLMKDMVAILLFASSSSVSDQAALDSCLVGNLLGREEELINFVKQRYIAVSRITGGATANTLGQLAQTQVFEYLSRKLGRDYDITRNGYIVLSRYDKSGGMPFDIVVSKGKKFVGIEVSFQVTTNSTIERKSGQAVDRFNMLHEDGHSIAYVLDGAGNFQRSSALATICANSDCTVAFSNSEFDVLTSWIQNELG